MRTGLFFVPLCLVATSVWAAEQPLPGTAPLTIEGDITSQLVDGADRFLLRELEQSVARRAGFWNRDLSSAEKYTASVEKNRKRLAHILGVRDARVAPVPVELIATPARSACIGEGPGYKIYAVRWPTIGDIVSEGLLLVPSRSPVADVIAVPDADQTPEMLAGLVDGVPAESQFARRLAESGCQVLVPTLVDRSVHQHRGAKLTNREYIYRAAFEMGRHVIGYEVQAVLAGVDHFAQQPDSARRKIGVIGWGQGAQAALCAAALDTRIGAACVSGYFACRQNAWQETLDRNVFGLLEQFGDAELASLIAPRALIVEAARGVEFEVPPGTGGGPGKLATPNLNDVRGEVERAQRLVAGLPCGRGITLVSSGDGSGPFGSEAALKAFLTPLGGSLAPAGTVPKSQGGLDGVASDRQQRLVYQMNRHTQRLLAESEQVRREFFAQLDTSSLAKFQQTVEPYRKVFSDEVIGRFDRPLLPPQVRTRKVIDAPKHVGYEVVMDVFPDLIAYGILLLPKDLQPGQRRPVVVCQHGLEGRPQDVLAGSPTGERYYKGFASELADLGFITFAPQNLYIFKDRFRTLQRKANLLGKTLFSMIVPQHQQIVDWLATLPQVDPQRIAFYGLSYGGKSAMRIPPLVGRYCLSICSGDFDEWVYKCASVGNRYTYMGTGEYEIFEFDLGNTFNYAEMAALIAPRQFMVERGHFDGVAPDEWVAYEYAKVRFLYQAKLGIGERTTIEWFNGPHKINGVGTYAFLRRWLDGPAR
jgi:dienelactone hydrolase